MKKKLEKLICVSRLNPNNEKEEQAYGENDEDVKVVGFYHAYCMCKGWENLVKEQLSHIKKSGLYNRLDTLYIGALILDENENMLKSIIASDSKYKILFTNQDRTLFEYPTLMALQQYCKKEKFVGFYFHTKGVSWIDKPSVYNIGNTWRIMAEYFMFDRYKLAIHTVNNGKDVYGTNYQEIFNDKYRLIGGNFFWFNSEYINTLYELRVNKEDRNESEKWILHNTHNIYCPFQFSGNSRNDAIPQELYMPCRPFKRKIVSIRVYFIRFKYIIRRLLGLKVNLINPLGKIS